MSTHHAKNVYGEKIDYELVPLHDGKTGHEVRAEGYKPRKVFTNFKGELVEDVVLMFDPERVVAMVDYPEAASVGELPTVRKLMQRCARHLGLGELVQGSVQIEPDRCYFRCSPDLATHLDHSGAFSRDKNKGRGHSYKEGWERIGSWRSRTNVVSLQAIVYRNGDQYVVEIDLDMGGLRHIGQVFGNAITRKTSDPIIMAQLVAYYWGLKLPFRLEVAA